MLEQVEALIRKLLRDILAEVSAPKRGYNYAEGAYYLGIGIDLMQKLVRDSDVPVRYIKSKPILDRADLDAYLESRPSERPTR